MFYKVDNNPLIHFKLINGDLVIYSDSDSNDIQRNSKISIFHNYSKVKSLSLKVVGFDEIKESGGIKTISGSIRIILSTDGGISEIGLADQCLLVNQKSKFKRKNEVSNSEQSNQLKKLIEFDWNTEFNDAISTLPQLERSQSLPGPQNNTYVGEKINFPTQAIHNNSSQSFKNEPSAINQFLKDLLMNQWTKIFIAVVLIFAILQMVVTVTSSALDVKNKKMEGEVFNSIGQSESEADAVKKVLKEMGIERNTDKNDLGCFVE